MKPASTPEEERETAKRLEVARKLATAAAANPKVVAVALVGSTARGRADAYSDIDLSIFYRERPTAEELSAFYSRLDMQDRRILSGTEETDFMDVWWIDGIEGQSGHLLLAGAEELLDDVLVRYDTDHDKHTVVGGLAEAIGLYGEEVVEGLKRRIAYPPELARAMVAAHLRFRSLQVLEKRFAGRDALFPFTQVLVDWERRILGILLGLNRVYPEHDFKRLGGLTQRLTIAPPDLDRRLRLILRADYDAAVRELGALVVETLDLVDGHMPDLDTNAIRQELARKL